jgi:hypothetical protein
MVNDLIAASPPRRRRLFVEEVQIYHKHACRFLSVELELIIYGPSMSELSVLVISGMTCCYANTVPASSSNSAMTSMLRCYQFNRDGRHFGYDKWQVKILINSIGLGSCSRGATWPTIFGKIYNIPFLIR